MFLGNRFFSEGNSILICVLLLSLMQTFTLVHAAAAPLHEMYKQGQYSALADSLIKSIETIYGKTPENYMLIIDCLSQVPGREHEADRYCAELEYLWRIDDVSTHEKTEAALSNIDAVSGFKRVGTLLAEIDTILGTNEICGSSAMTSHKIYSKSPSLEEPVSHERIKVISPKSLEELSVRLFEPHGTSRAYNTLLDLVAPLDGNFKIVHSDHFIIVSSSSGLTKKKLHKICADLEKFLQFFVKKYDMPIPPYLITVYLVPDMNRLTELARKIHGLRITGRCIGYSHRNDLSIAAVIWRMIYGTLPHELFHLMVKMNFGDIPPWLDEGMAALYEEYDISNEDSIIGLSNWRGDSILVKTGLASISDIVQMDAVTFHYSKSEKDWHIINQAVNHATARYFVLWLQDTGKLTEVYFRLRDLKIEEKTTNPRQDVVRILEEILGDLTAVQKDVEGWFKTKHP